MKKRLFTHGFLCNTKISLQKIIVLIVAFIACNSIGYSQNINIPDANFKAELLANVTINTNGDGEIEVSEAEAYSGTINVNMKSISDLTGIEAFGELTELLCAGNMLASLDISQNTKLVTLDCKNNLITTLDLSQNIQLESVTCVNNLLTSLDFSQNEVLDYVSCFDNQITNLNVSQNTLLTYLDCFDNQLVSLDVTQNTQLETFLCFNNQITSLDLSQNAQLLTLFAYSNNLSALNIANGSNALITSFNVVLNPALACIQIDPNFTPTSVWNEDVTADYSTACTTLSTDGFTLSKNTISLAPNPATEVLNIHMSTTLKQAVIYSVLGSEVLKTTATQIPISHLRSGIYSIEIKDIAGVSIVKRFIKQ